MVDFVDTHIREAKWNFEGVPVTVKTTKHISDGMVNVHIQAFAKDEDDNPPGFHIGVASSVLEKYDEEGENILLFLLGEIEGYFVGHYLFKFSNRKPDGFVPHFTEQIKEAPLEN